MMKRTLTAALAAILVTGCATPGKSPGYSTRVKSEGPDTTLETRIYTSETCRSEGGQESLLGAVAGLVLKPLLEAAVYRVGDALQKAGEEQKTQITETKSVQYYKVDWAKDKDTKSQPNLKTESKLKPNVGCYTIVHGALARPDDKIEDLSTKLIARFPDVAEKLPETVSYRILAPGAEKTKAPTKAEFSDDIRLYARFSVESSDDKTAVQIKPDFVLIGAPFAKKKSFVSDKRDIVITLKMQGAGQTGSNDAFAISNVKLINVKTNTILDGEKAAELSSGWFPLAPVPASTREHVKTWDATRSAIKDQAEVIERLKSTRDNGTKPGEGPLKGTQIPLTEEDRSELQAALAKTMESLDLLKARVQNAPFTFTSPGTVAVTLTETRDGNKFLTDLGNYITASKATIAQPFFNELDPETREAADASAADTKDTLRIAAIGSVAAYAEAEAKTGDDRSEAAIRITEIKAEQACRKLRDNGQFEVACIDH